MTGHALTLTARAKVNLALHVTGRRPDGYHRLDSIVAFAAFGDTVTLEPAAALALAVTGRFAAHAPADASNLASRAAEAFFAALGRAPGISIAVEKNIPAGAGLGGGSADAAAVLAGLNRQASADIPPERLAAIGLKLGADVPMCLAGCTLRAGGIGEAIEPLAGWPGLPLVLVWPGRALATAEVFRALARRDNPPLPPLPEALGSPEAAAGWLAGCRNDLEAPALGLAPVIGEALQALRGVGGCLLARMSGSGSACFGLFADIGAARAAAAAIQADAPDWWVVATEAG